MEYHEYANLFPMMNKEEITRLCDDMRDNGYDKTSPIILYEGKILDGRNRQLAADTVGIDAEYADFEGTDALAFVIRHNLNRRHLNESQRAVVAGRLETMKRGGQGANQYKSKDANLHVSDIYRKDAAEMLNVSPRTVATVKAVERAAPELIEKIERGEMTAHEAQKTIKAQERNEKRAELAQAGAMVEKSDKWNIYHADIRTWQAVKQYDFIITDPPYPREFLPLWSVLAQRSKDWLKPGGLLIAMSGQSYLDEIYSMMSEYMKYYWTACYLTPGQPTPLRQVNVNTTWKPLLIYSNGNYSGKIFGDVTKSEGNDKDFHKWGQSESGMEDIIAKFCLPGQSILDPFCGAGTTGIAAINYGCFFDGVDIEIDNVNISKSRMYDTEKDR